MCPLRLGVRRRKCNEQIEGLTKRCAETTELDRNPQGSKPRRFEQLYRFERDNAVSLALHRPRGDPLKHRPERIASRMECIQFYALIVSTSCVRRPDSAMTHFAQLIFFLEWRAASNECLGSRRNTVWLSNDTGIFFVSVDFRSTELRGEKQNNDHSPRGPHISDVELENG
ncbi:MULTISPECIES: hypothetical protein [unclassified Bradyrhizobium]|uniref:hypothetical protein n=1 Tax=unclassified Bradyrhizobium TaxID=2631580 RepID=UPI001CD42C2D|nr:MULTISPECIES: hypothetical protein [unclassified Bradyrhizobium]MCA1385644.1 hypothetical protein [Bradyrhizobium sp. BRP05]MCA1430963.1 hypothetical protein [Bradyrhizobium sp. NBAIM16]MCA1394413.1 hypothetical protein [Bradyrhizobium sp. IC3123]MCA1423945.1 hypothetical protein [Bradyrhizobium sp. BRP23]MCA1438493.1 hypothetical protein [Bradyrhizobium sp. BRP20]